MTDPAPQLSADKPGMPRWLRMLLVALCAILGVFALGAMAGVVAAAREDGLSALTAALLAFFLAFGAGIAWLGWKLYPSPHDEPEAPRVRTSRAILWIGGAIGGVLGLLLSVSTDIAGGGSLFSNSAIPAVVAAIAIAGWIFAAIGLTVAWLRSIDEHEMQANNAGALAGLYAYLMIEPSWWLGWRGGFLPEQQPMFTFLIVLAVYTIVWFWRRSR